MASRRLRIKPVANVPVRRGKANVESEKCDNRISDINPVEAKLTQDAAKAEELPSEVESSDKHKNIPPFAVASTSNSNSNKTTVDTSTSLNSDTSEGPVKLKVDENPKEKDGSTSIPEVSANLESASTVAPVPNKSIVPPGLARKRMKPTVSISAVTRRPRELNKSLNNEQTNNTPPKVDDVKEINMSSDKYNETLNEKQAIVSPCFQNVDVSVSGVKDIGVGIPGITQIIPTGTAIRPQNERITGATIPIVGKGEAPQSMPEPDLPSEGAGGGDIMSKHSKVTIPRSRFIRPTPRININSRNRKPNLNNSCNVDSDNESQKLDDPKELVTPETIGKSGNAVSASESDETRKSESNTLTSPTKNLDGTSKASVMNETSHCTESEQRLEKTGNVAHASESDDESKRYMSDASTITPPVRKIAESSRGRFVKPTPRFIEASARRNSMQGSASESEDEGRKSLSVASTITPPFRRHADIKSEFKDESATRDDVYEEPEKKSRNKRVPSSCMLRMARARQEFHNKFGNKTPDRSRLTMFDLIFYNPTTNPMKSTQEQPNERQKTTSITLDGEEERVIEERLNEEQIDEPSAQDNDRNIQEEEEDVDMAMPVPQVKVGPDGQIILDEKSLVIETTGAKKSREDLANSAVVIDYGNGSTGYGTYSKIKRKTKEWSTRETLKFYRALNTVGTDFLLMQSIFPKRTRQDLKMKFKKEDRLNRYLVEKALRNPLDFDLTELEKDLEKEEEEERLKKLKKVLPKNEKKKTKRKKTKDSFLAKCLDAADRGTIPKKSKSGTKRKNTESQGNMKNKKIRKSNYSKKTVESSDEENSSGIENELRFSPTLEFDNSKERRENTSDNEADELEFLNKPPKPTRSGRIPQPRKVVDLQDEDREQEEEQEGEEENVEQEEDAQDEVENRGNESSLFVGSKNEPKNTVNQTKPLEDLTNIEPGSLVVVASQSPTDPTRQVYKVFMVTPTTADQSHTGGVFAPVTVPLPPSLLQSMPNGFMNENLNPIEQQNEPHSDTEAEAVPHLTELTPVQQQTQPEHLSEVLSLPSEPVSELNQFDLDNQQSRSELTFQAGSQSYEEIESTKEFEFVPVSEAEGSLSQTHESSSAKSENLSIPVQYNSPRQNQYISDSGKPNLIALKPL